MYEITSKADLLLLPQKCITLFLLPKASQPAERTHEAIPAVNICRVRKNLPDFDSRANINFDVKQQNCIKITFNFN